jgi:hypothetical protein
VTKLERARFILRYHDVIVERPDRRRLNIRGTDFSYGVGKDLDDAELGLRRHKTEREHAGEIARGELRGVTVTLHNRKTKDSSARLQNSPATVVPIIDPSLAAATASLVVTSVIL